MSDLSDDLSTLTVDELVEAYHEIVATGADRAACGRSIGPQVMQGSAIKSELRARDVTPEEVL